MAPPPGSDPERRAWVLGILIGLPLTTKAADREDDNNRFVRGDVPCDGDSLDPKRASRRFPSHQGNRCQIALGEETTT